MDNRTLIELPDVCFKFLGAHRINAMYRSISGPHQEIGRERWFFCVR